MNNEEQQKFIEEYNELCEKHKMLLVAVPQWILRDDGMYAMRVQFVVKEFEQQK